MLPNLKENRSRIAYALARRFYFFCLFSYFPCIVVLSFISEMNMENNMLGIWLPFLFLSLFSLPVFVGFLLIGVFVNHILCMATGTFGKKAGRQGILFYSLCLLCLLLTFACAIMYTGDILPLLSLFGVCAFCVTAAILFIAAHAKLKREVRKPQMYSPEFEKKISTYNKIFTVVLTTALILSFLFPVLSHV